jgi:hypothetical protein
MINKLNKVVKIKHDTIRFEDKDWFFNGETLVTEKGDVSIKLTGYEDKEWFFPFVTLKGQVTLETEFKLLYTPVEK